MRIDIGRDVDSINTITIIPEHTILRFLFTRTEICSLHELSQAGANDVL
jgi:hypothetical protein